MTALEAVRSRGGSEVARLNGLHLTGETEAPEPSELELLADRLREVSAQIVACPEAIERSLAGLAERYAEIASSSGVRLEAALEKSEAELRQLASRLAAQTRDVEALTSIVQQLASEVQSSVARIEERLAGLAGVAEKIARGQKLVVETLFREVVATDEVGNVIGSAKRV